MPASRRPSRLCTLTWETSVTLLRSGMLVKRAVYRLPAVVFTLSLPSLGMGRLRVNLCMSCAGASVPPGFEGSGAGAIIQISIDYYYLILSSTRYAPKREPETWE